MENFAFCNNCKAVVPAKHIERDGKIFVEKDCPKCGVTEYLISTDAGLYNKKRDFVGEIKHVTNCKLNCSACSLHGRPDIVFVDTTNRCNMNCRICLNNVLSMGFKFEPRMEYFDRIFKHYSTYDPKPYIQLFGGEPTVREDLFDIIKLGKSYGFSMRVVTNGLKLADEKFCNELTRLGVMINFAFDGLNRDMYTKLRGREDALDLKLKALENLGRHRRGKVILMTVVDKGYNKDDISDILRFSFENSHIIRGIYFMPLIYMWDKEKFDYDPEKTTLEDVEHMVNNSVGGANVEFVPLGSFAFKYIYKTFGVKNMPFEGAHPNCESMTYLISDGKRYVPVSNYLKTSLYRLIGDLRDLEKYTASRYRNNKISLFSKLKVYGRALAIAGRHLNFGAIVGAKGPAVLLRWAKITWKIITGRKVKDVMRQDTRLKGALQIIIFSFEDDKTTESERLSMCTSCFAYVDPLTDSIKTLPTCTWEKYKKPIMKVIAEKFNV
jgi:7,8-dihydro-6-hydroxymethylpterin dimethyltransferase